MPYQFAHERANYAEYASGAVFYGLSGVPTFPLRLASEMFQRCVALLHAGGRPGPYTLYDPCCGSGYLLSTLAYFHWHDIGAVIGSDVDERALSLAEANLSLLTLEGLERRTGQIKAMLAAYGKVSHREALDSALRLQAQLREHLAVYAIETRSFYADVTDRQSLIHGLQEQTVDVVLTDVPYGQHSVWQAAQGDPIRRMLDALQAVISSHTVLAIAADKRQKIAHEEYRRLERFQIGRRQVMILQIANGKS